MKWEAKSQSIKPRHYEIKLDPSAGYYLYVYENSKCIRDYLNDSLELALEYALEDFGVPLELWEKIKE
ncbi:MAG: hypothetical protein AB7H48_00405 [Parachlamydiales bacterium]